MAKSNITSTQFAAKKLLGKSHVRNTFTDAQEAYPSTVSVVSDGVFAEAIPRQPGTAMYTVYSGSVEKVYFDIVPIGDSVYDANDAGEGGEEAQSSGHHAYYLKLPSNYETTSSNSKKGTGEYTNSKRLYLSKGGLQIVPPFTTDAGLPGASGNNYYGIEIYKGDPTNVANKISETSAIDWQFDYYSGIIFVQDYDASLVPVTASAYLYVGKYLQERLTDIAGGSNLIVKEEGSNLTTAASSINFVGSSITATNSGNNVTVTVTGGDVSGDGSPQLGGDLDVNGNDIVSTSNGNINILPNGSGKVIIDGNGSSGGVSITDGLIDMKTGTGNVSTIDMYCEVTNAHKISLKAPTHGSGWSGNIDFVLPPTEGTSGQVLKTDGNGNTSWTNAMSYGRTAVTANVTSSVGDRILGVNATASLQITLPAASAFSSGQNFTIKDEAGNANTNNITIRAAGSDTIDGQASVVLQSSHAAINIYSNGSNKFFIY